MEELIRKYIKFIKLLWNLINDIYIVVFNNIGYYDSQIRKLETYIELVNQLIEQEKEEEIMILIISKSIEDLISYHKCQQI